LTVAALWIFVCTPMTTNVIGFKMSLLLGVNRVAGAILFGLGVLGPAGSIVGLIVHYFRLIRLMRVLFRGFPGFSV
jgi:hypothetical protein